MNPISSKLHMFRCLLWLPLAGLLLSGCATGKDILYFQDADTYNATPVAFKEAVIQPNDVLQITVSAGIPETAIPYNRGVGNNNGGMMNPQFLNLMGYLVSLEGYITMPVLGKIKVLGKSTTQLEAELVEILESGDHLVTPSVNVRLINGKVTVLGEVRSPGTFTFTEQNLTIPQVLGLAGDLTINGRRDDVLLIREMDGGRQITHIDLTSASFMTDPELGSVKPNDILVVQPNKARIKNAGFVGNIQTLLAVTTTVLSIVIILTR
jgi:polysaccharide biosynthesis/export protein